METIALEVDDALAKAWKNSTQSERVAYGKKISEVLRELQKTKFNELLDKAGKIAADNGLTEDKLKELLKDDIDANNGRYEWWNDEEMLAELDKTEADFRSGKDPGITWDALKAELLSRRKKMQANFLFLATAQKEIRKSFDWYEERSDGLMRAECIDRRGIISNL